MADKPLQKHDIVKLKPEVSGNMQDKQTAQVRAVASPDGTGEVWLDHNLHGSMYWDQSQLDLVLIE